MKGFFINNIIKKIVNIKLVLKIIFFVVKLGISYIFVLKFVKLVKS